MDTSADVLQLIEESYKTFSKGQRYIANYICSNYDKRSYASEILCIELNLCFTSSPNAF